MESIQLNTEMQNYDECQVIPEFPAVELQSIQHTNDCQTSTASSQTLINTSTPAHHNRENVHEDSYLEEQYSPEVTITKLHRRALYPIRRWRYGNAKFYLLSPYTIRIPPRSTIEVLTGLCLVIPPGYKYDIVTRSKLSHAYNVHAISSLRAASRYVSEHLKVKLINASSRSVCIPRKKQFATLTIYKLANDVQLYLE